MPSQEDIANQQELLAAHRRTLTHLLKQQVLIGGGFVPPAIANGIDEARASIRRIKITLREWGIAADDLPDDEPPAERARATSGARRASRAAALVGAVALVGTIGALAFMFLSQTPQPAHALQAALYWSQCDATPVWVLPGTIAPAHDPRAARAQIGQALAAKTIETWQVAGLDAGAINAGRQPDGERKLFMTVRGAGDSKIDIHLFNKASVTVSTQPGPQHLDVVAIRTIDLMDCPSGSGGGVNRTAPPIDLLEQMQQYSNDTQYTNDDYLPLNSETSEVLVFPFACRNPGVYTIQIRLRYRDNIRSQAGTYLSDTLPTIVCPSSFTFWPITYAPGAAGASQPAVQIGTPLAFHWDGARYAPGLN